VHLPWHHEHETHSEVPEQVQSAQPSPQAVPAERTWRLTEHGNPERDAYLREMVKELGEA